MPESNWGSRWWRDWIGKKSDSSCKISNETVAGIEILFKEKDLKYLEFVFVYYRDDPIRKDHDWEFFDRLSLRKRQNRINLNSGPLFEILVKHWICYLMSAFREKRPIEVEGFFKQQGAGSTIQSNDIEHVSHLFSRNKWAISLQNCAQFHMWQFRQDLFVSWGKNPDFLRNVSRENLIWLDNVLGDTSTKPSSSGDAVGPVAQRIRARESTSTDMPLGTAIHNIEITLGKGGQLARAAGAVAKLIAKEGKSATLKLPSGEVRLISKNCSATVGQVGNVGVNQKSLGGILNALATAQFRNRGHNKDFVTGKRERGLD
ncbi:hypothetical protein E3N88_04178 [Mikania micrantha]|uniref:Large ribosomal subunit protein uL2 C-terminal domain-containing protein n=1 Tax=Mikania micrantha TaxID=192012 RepID=A0A5N6PWI3_9ASTR|nr:hypothetical protein E3N88_04178 [Mikania micrantha]